MKFLMIQNLKKMKNIIVFKKIEIFININI